MQSIGTAFKWLPPLGQTSPSTATGKSSPQDTKGVPGNPLGASDNSATVTDSGSEYIYTQDEILALYDAEKVKDPPKSLLMHSTAVRSEPRVPSLLQEWRLREKELFSTTIHPSTKRPGQQHHHNQATGESAGLTSKWQQQHSHSSTKGSASNSTWSRKASQAEDHALTEEQQRLKDKELQEMEDAAELLKAIPLGPALYEAPSESSRFAQTFQSAVNSPYASHVGSPSVTPLQTQSDVLAPQFESLSLDASAASSPRIDINQIRSIVSARQAQDSFSSASSTHASPTPVVNAGPVGGTPGVTAATLTNDTQNQNQSPFTGSAVPRSNQASTPMTSDLSQTDSPASAAAVATATGDMSGSAAATVSAIQSLLAQQQSIAQSYAPFWQYLDKQNNVQGPFNSMQMHEWYAQNFFTPDLQIKRTDDPSFSNLQNLILFTGNVEAPFLFFYNVSQQMVASQIQSLKQQQLQQLAQSQYHMSHHPAFLHQNPPFPSSDYAHSQPQLHPEYSAQGFQQHQNLPPSMQPVYDTQMHSHQQTDVDELQATREPDSNALAASVPEPQTEVHQSEQVSSEKQSASSVAELDSNSERNDTTSFSKPEAATETKSETQAAQPSQEQQPAPSNEKPAKKSETTALDTSMSSTPVSKKKAPAPAPWIEKATTPVSRDMPNPFAEELAAEAKEKSKASKGSTNDAPKSSTKPNPIANIITESVPSSAKPSPTQASPAPWLNKITTPADIKAKSFHEIQESEEREERRRRAANAASNAASSAASRAYATQAKAAEDASWTPVSSKKTVPHPPQALQNRQQQQSRRPSPMVVSVDRSQPSALPHATSAPTVAVAPTVNPASQAKATAPQTKYAAPKLPAPAVPRSSAPKPPSYSVDNPPPPSKEFDIWIRTRLNDLTNPDEFIPMILAFPLDASQDISEIIADGVYANSTTINGRQFAHDFINRRKADAVLHHPELDKELRQRTGGRGAPALSMAQIAKSAPPPKTSEWSIKPAKKKK